jgi:hypothetical protein
MLQINLISFTLKLLFLVGCVFGLNNNKNPAVAITHKFKIFIKSTLNNLIFKFTFIYFVYLISHLEVFYPSKIQEAKKKIKT